MAITRATIVHEGPGGPFDSMLVADTAAGIQPGLLLYPNFMGTKEWDFAKAEELAALGYKVLVIDYYGQGRRGTDMESAARLMTAVNDDRAMLRGRLLDGLALLRGQPGVDAERIGALGFCFGGKCVLDLARAGASIRGGVVFHGVYDGPPFPNAAMTAKLLICHGWNDPLCPPDASVALAQELTAAGVDWQLHAYGHTGHAFTADNMPIDDARTFGFQADANRRSWTSATVFLTEALA